MTSKESSLIGVRVAPGVTMYTRTLAGPNSAAHLRAGWISATFVAEESPTYECPNVRHPRPDDHDRPVSALCHRRGQSGQHIRGADCDRNVASRSSSLIGTVSTGGRRAQRRVHQWALGALSAVATSSTATSGDTTHLRVAADRVGLTGPAPLTRLDR